ncbi:MAG: PH domain-containing protein, partial [Bacteroidota bacterium]
MRKPFIIKKSPVVIVKNFILLQGGAIAAFFIASALADYAEIYHSLPLTDLVSFQIAEAAFLFLVETVLIFFIFFRWYRESFFIRNNEIIHAKGILYRHRTTIPLEHIVSASYRQGPLGKLTKYG